MRVQCYWAWLGLGATAGDAAISKLVPYFDLNINIFDIVV